MRRPPLFQTPGSGFVTHVYSFGKYFLSAPHRPLGEQGGQGPLPPCRLHPNERMSMFWAGGETENKQRATVFRGITCPVSKIKFQKSLGWRVSVTWVQV